MKRFAFLLLLVPSFIYAQKPIEQIIKQDTINFVDIYNYDQQTINDITIENKVIHFNREHSQFLRGKSFRNFLTITECQFIGRDVVFDSVAFEGLYLAYNRYSGWCSFTNSSFKNEFHFQELFKSNGRGLSLYISECKFNSVVSFDIHNEGAFVNIQIENSKFDSNNIDLSYAIGLPQGIGQSRFQPRQFHQFDSSFYIPSLGIITTGNEIDKLTFSNNEFVHRPGFEFQIKGKFNQLIIENNNFDSLGIVLGQTTISNKLYVVDNKNIGFLGFLDFTPPEFPNNIVFPYNQINGQKIILSESIPSNNNEWGLTLTFIFQGMSDEEIKSVHFEELINNYYLFYNVYKQRGDIESMNQSFVDIKDIQLRKLEYNYRSNTTFQKYFRWKLNQLLKIYTNHGTDPALAIVISMYVVIAFAIFCFFFPSEWDITSKSKLIKDFKDFTQKNDKGYIRPFLSMLLGFIISLINALTLSLNAFTTLGFGRIPTKGLAKYVCVIQGFIGWFLLSIFTVALINQVLA